MREGGEAAELAATAGPDWARHHGIKNIRLRAAQLTLHSAGARLDWRRSCEHSSQTWYSPFLTRIDVCRQTIPVLVSLPAGGGCHDLGATDKTRQ